MLAWSTKTGAKCYLITFALETLVHCYFQRFLILLCARCSADCNRTAIERRHHHIVLRRRRQLHERKLRKLPPSLCAAPCIVVRWPVTLLPRLLLFVINSAALPKMCV